MDHAIPMPNISKTTDSTLRGIYNLINKPCMFINEQRCA
jgi:hypothetical protein